MATDFDPYQILEVERSAGQDQIDAAYRRQWAAHGSGPAPDARLREIQTAYRILSDPEERRAYDARLAERAMNGGMTVAPPPEAAPVSRATGPGQVPWGMREIAIAIAVIVGFVVISSVPIVLLAELVAGDKDLNDDPNALAIEFLASAAFQTAAFWSAWRFGPHKFKLPLSALGLKKPIRGLPWLPFGLVSGAMFIVIVYGLFLSAIGVSPNTDLPDATYNHVLPLTVIIILTIGVAPFVEEIFFRGFVFSGIAHRWGPTWGAAGSGVLFGIAHLGNAGYFYVIPPIVLIGVLFAWSYYYTKSLFPSMAAHFMFNLIQIVGTLASR